MTVRIQAASSAEEDKLETDGVERGRKEEEEEDKKSADNDNDTNTKVSKRYALCFILIAIYRMYMHTSIPQTSFIVLGILGLAPLNCTAAPEVKYMFPARPPSLLHKHVGMRLRQARDKMKLLHTKVVLAHPV